MTIKEQIITEIDKLPIELQKKVLDFSHALALSLPKGTPGKQLIRFSGVINSDDIKRMSQAIEVACEQVDKNDW